MSTTALAAPIARIRPATPSWLSIRAEPLVERPFGLVLGALVGWLAGREGAWDHACSAGRRSIS